MRDLQQGTDLRQALILRLDAARWHAPLERVLERVQPGGVWLNVPRLPDPGSTAALLLRIARSLPVVPFLCLDEEGGEADPLQGVFAALPAVGTAARQGLDGVERLGELIGSALVLLGFNTTLAPALDLSQGPPGHDQSGHVLSSEPEETARSAEAFVRGLQRERVLCCARHFPGLRVQSLKRDKYESSSPAIIGMSMGDLWREDLLPYRRVLNRLDMVLMSPAAYKAYDYDLPQPASRSERVIEGLLRTKLDYSGLAVADLAGQGDVEGSSERAENAVQALKAGCDLLIVTEQEHPAEEIHCAVERAVNSGRLPLSRVEQALRRIAEAKKRLTSPQGRVSSSSVHKLAQRFDEFTRGIRYGNRANSAGSPVPQPPHEA